MVNLKEIEDTWELVDYADIPPGDNTHLTNHSVGEGYIITPRETRQAGQRRDNIATEIWLVIIQELQTSSS
ncbi:hypothetical protein GcC1_036032 [Golovinomyces cichoracearum]|uniref:Uncharacterized protein n=1 Tax=Golovinomyces cichoracearum TaxID=62708 RepID=A0A420J0X0_9PEZI|nr:hypothetical protein GcC1_036032 [Golovinomyces cichoracearum]